MVVKPNCLHCYFIILLGIVSVLPPTSQVLYTHFRNDFYNTVDDIYCLTQQGTSGKCVPIYDCPESKKLIISNSKPKICWWIARVPIICCPTHIKLGKWPANDTKTTTTSVPKIWTTTRATTGAASTSSQSTPKTLVTSSSRYTFTSTTKSTPYFITSTTPSSTSDFPETIPPHNVELPNRLPYSPHTMTESPDVTTKLTFDDQHDHEFSNTRSNEDYQIPHCGTRVIKKNRYRIVGGTEAYPGEFPWSAAIFAKTLDGKLVQECGGTIISDRHILTAAHCFSTLNTNNYVVGVGSGLLRKTLKYEIKMVNQHPKYDPDFYYNDIALIETKAEIRFNMFVRPVCLSYESIATPGDEVSIAGWGYLNYNGQKSDVLNKAKINIISRKKCNETYAKHRSSKIPDGITDHFICAGAPDYTRDACEADSGGALIKREVARFRAPLKEFEGRFVQIGVVSFGYKCAHDGYPGVYTNVARFMHWIKENVDLRLSKSPPLV